MKRILAWALALMLVLTAAGACAEAEDAVLETLAGLTWSFSSGAGAWSTELAIQPDGSFTGLYHDSDMGDSGEDYPDGTVYWCEFSGQFTLAGEADENALILRVEQLQKAQEDAGEEIRDGVRYVYAEPYGLSAGDEMLLYRPGTPVSALPEGMLLWAHAMDPETPATELTTWFLCSPKNDSGFVGEEAFADVALPNPWQDMTAEQLQQATGLVFGVPEGAQDVLYRYLPGEGLAEMQFTLEGDEFCARIQPAALAQGELMNISGMYFAWENEEAVEVGGCAGTIGEAQTGSTEWVELCQWYDAAPGLMYCLSVYSTDPDGLDLVAVAEMVYVPVQGDAE